MSLRLSAAETAVSPVDERFSHVPEPKPAGRTNGGGQRENPRTRIRPHERFYFRGLFPMQLLRRRARSFLSNDGAIEKLTAHGQAVTLCYYRIR